MRNDYWLIWGIVAMIGALLLVFALFIIGLEYSNKVLGYLFGWTVGKVGGRV